jgi:hypothetical protein
VQRGKRCCDVHDHTFTNGERWCGSSACARNNAVASLGGSFTIATGGAWSGGTGTFAPSTTNMNATYTPTAAEIANGLVTSRLTTTGNGTCNQVTDNMHLELHDFAGGERWCCCFAVRATTHKWPSTAV